MTEEERDPKQRVYTRGEGLPHDRSGPDPGQSVQPKGKRTKHADKVRREKQDRALKEAQRNFLTKKVTQRVLFTELDNFVPSIHANTQKISDLGLRAESLIHVFRKLVENTKGVRGLFLRWLLGRDFYKQFNNETRRMFVGRETITGILDGVRDQTTGESAPLPLNVIRDRLQQWTEDPENTPITGGSFPAGFMERRIIEDFSLSREEKTDFMQEVLKYPETLVTHVLSKAEEKLKAAEKATGPTDLAVDIAEEARLEEAAESKAPTN